MLNTRHCILFRPHIELELAQLVITGFLEGTEVENELFIIFALLTEVGVKLRNAALLLIFALVQILYPPLIDISKVLLREVELLCIAVLQLLDFFRVLGFKLRLDVLVGRQDTVHVLFSLLLRIQKTELRPIHLVLETLDLLFKVSVFTAQEVLVLVEQVNFSLQALVTSLYIKLGFLQPAVLQLKLGLLAFQGAELMLNLPQLLVGLVHFAALFV